MNIPTAIPLSIFSILYSAGCYLFIFLWVLGRKRAGRLESNQQKRLPTNSAGPLSTDGFRRNPCGPRPLARDAHPFALILHSSRGREVNGSRLRLHTLCRYASGLKIGLSLSCLYHPSFSWRGEFLISLVVTSIVAGQVPSLLGQVHPGASSYQRSQNRFASYLCAGPFIIAFHIVDL